MIEAKIPRTRTVKGMRVHVWNSQAPAIVDEDKFVEVSRRSWSIDPSGYVKSNYKLEDGREGMLRLANFVLGRDTDQTEQIIYLSGDKLDCRLSNLAIVSKAVVGSTAKLSRNNTSGFKGVNWGKPVNKWVATIHAYGKKIHLGCFEDKVEAAKSYDAAAVKYFGEVAMTNKRMGLYE